VAEDSLLVPALALDEKDHHTPDSCLAARWGGQKPATNLTFHFSGRVAEGSLLVPALALDEKEFTGHQTLISNFFDLNPFRW